MAQYLNSFYKVMANLSWFAASACYAEVLSDPTKPPLALLNPEAIAQEVETRVVEPVLQSVTLGSQRKSAMIDGQSVHLGERYQQFKLVSLSANKAVLQSANGTQKVLQLSFSINKHIVSSSSQDEGNQNK